jgi:hypothetical protein
VESFPRRRGRILVASPQLDLFVHRAFDERFSRDAGLHSARARGFRRVPQLSGQRLRGSGAGPIRGFRVTHRDKQIVRWVGRLRMATAQQVAERFGLGRAVTYARLGVLVRLGLLEHARIFHGAPGVYLATRAGLAAVDLALPPARVDLRTYAHDFELSSSVVDLEREFGREQVSTEREMRAADTPAGSPPAMRPRFAVALAGARGQLQLTPAGHPRLHFPDCVIASGGETQNTVLAVELERTPKGRARLRRILAGYVGARHIGAVRYYALGERVRDLVETEVAAHRAQALIEVRDWPTPPHSRAWQDAAA